MAIRTGDHSPDHTNAKGAPEEGALGFRVGVVVGDEGVPPGFLLLRGRAA